MRQDSALLLPLKASVAMRLKLLVAALLFSGFVVAADWNVDADGLAIQGYDPVAYFTVNKAVVGDSQYFVKWNGAVWHFSDDQNRSRFIADPLRYAPQFGGYCANGLSDGHRVSGNGRHWRIIDDQLFLFYSAWGRLQWAIDVDSQRQLASENWLRFKSPD